MPSSPTFWISKCCGANCRSTDRACWNCGTPRNRTRSAKTVELTCATCGLEHLGLTSTHYEGGDGIIGLCPFYFEHHGDRAYYPPNFVPLYLLELNGYEFVDGAVRKIQ